MPTGRGPAWVALGLLLAALVALLVLTTPWDTLPGGKRTEASPDGDFTAAEIEREEDFHGSVRPPAYLGLVFGLATAAVLGLTSWGGRLAGFVAKPLGGGWLAVAAVGGVVVAVVPRLVTLPLDARAEVVLRRYGLSTQTWGSWTVDQLKSAGIGAVIVAVTLAGVFGLARRWPDGWWLPAAVAAALLTFGLSYLYPVVIEPVFNKFTSMEEGPLRTSLLELAERDGVPVADVLVADASRRTTALNAYVSGLGNTRRIVVYDTLVEQATSEEVELVVAHELGHVVEHDVRDGTLAGAMGAAAGAIVLFLALGAWWRRAGIDSPTDPRGVALALFVVAVLTTLSGPVLNLVSRRVEARADLHSLELTRDAQTFVESERRLALTNLGDIKPNRLLVALFASHPPTIDRIAMARDWARREDLPAPGPLVHHDGR